jgi:mannose-6-phosphate isomerase-like protein (cupin superfamily)
MYRKIVISNIAKLLHKPWTPLKIGSVEDYDLKLAVFEGEYFRHHHTNHDEFIYVYNGKISIEFDDSEVELREGEGVFISKGTPHKSKCLEGKALILLFEQNTNIDDFVID